jgi:hypothetical protein
MWQASSLKIIYRLLCCLRLQQLPFICQLLLCLPAIAQTNTQLQRYQFMHKQMGTQFRILLYAPDSMLARQAASEAFGALTS